MVKIQIAVLVAAVALLGTVGMTVVATNGGAEGEEGNSVMHRLHELGQRLHGGGHHQDHMAGLIEQLELTPDQLGRIEKVHEIMAAQGDGAHASMAELHGHLVAQFEQGQVEADEIRRTIDDHVEQIRETAYAATDELIELVNGLDARQREIVLEHLQANAGGQQAGTHGHAH